MPLIDLDWEEGLFRIVRGFARTIFGGREKESPEGEVLLSQIDGRLAALGSLVAGRALRVLPARERGGVRGSDLLVPASLHVSSTPEDNLLLYVVRVVLAAQMVKMGAKVDEGDVLERALRGSIEEFPGFHAAWVAAREVEQGIALAESCLWGPRIPSPFDPLAAGSDSGEEPAPGVDGDATEIEAPPLEELTIHRMKEEAMELPTHSFEKVEMAESFGGTFRDPDGSDELDAHLEALQEVDLGHLLRGGPSAGSLMKADIALGAEVPSVADVDANEPFEAYDEWDARKTRYLEGWCRVYPTCMPPGDERWASQALVRHRRTIDRLYAELSRHRDRLRERPRALDGDDVDIDAMCQAYATLRAGRTPTRRLYVERARKARDLATTVLLDVSLSTDSWVDNHRVLDVAKESVLVLGEVADRLGDELQILAFASHTRHKVRCWMVRDWHEPWSRGRARLGTLEPQGYTRIGPALRHATEQLRATKAQRKLLLLVSDCKPTDYDRYEGGHGMSDVHKALAEARQRDVWVHALAIDAVAKSWLPGMFGPGQWAVLPRPEALPDALTQAYGRSA